MPWYTTADARRDAEKQAASKNRESADRQTREGRAIGAGQLGAQEIAGKPVIFSPRNKRNAA